MPNSSCPLCHLIYDQNLRSPPRAAGDNLGVDCPRCGKYVITGTLEAIYRRNEPDESRWHFSCAIRERTIYGLETRLHTKITLNDLVMGSLPSTPRVKSERLMSSLVRMAGNPGTELDIVLPQDCVLAFTASREEFTEYLNDLKDRGLLKVIAQGLGWIKLKVSIEGFEHANEFSPELTRSSSTTIGKDESHQEGGMPIELEPNVDKRRVFLVHGRDRSAHDAMMAFLRSLDLDPWDFDRARTSMRHGSPHIGDVLKWAFENTWCVVILITGDDEARLRRALWGTKEKDAEKNLSPQARPNVVFEAGRALALHEKRTVLIQLGESKPFSDVAGRFIHRFEGSAEDRKGLREVLRSLECKVGESGEWLKAGDFEAALGTDGVRETQPPPITEEELLAEERELLAASGQDGTFHLLSVGNFAGPWVRAGHVNFQKKGEPSYAAGYLDALESLRAKGFVRRESDKLFILTGRGFKLQKAIKGNQEAQT